VVTQLADDAWLDPSIVGERARAWGQTMHGHRDVSADVRVAHTDTHASIEPTRPLMREEREANEDAWLVRGATRASGGGERFVEEAPDPLRTCFERDRDRILHSSAYRRLAGKTQVFVSPTDHQRTRMTHALEVAQVARSIAHTLRLNVALAEAIALGHDCGHGPGGHASEDALSPYLEGGYDHATWGADVVLVPLNLCAQTIDGIRNHSWSRPAPSTPEGEVVSWADRIAYVCHDFEDAVSAGIITIEVLPASVKALCGVKRSDQLNAFIRAIVNTATTSGRIGMDADMADALADFRRCNYERIYLRPASVQQANQVIDILRGLTDFYIDRPNLIPEVQRAGGLTAATPEAVRAAVTYVGGMTDRFAFAQAVAHLDWDRHTMPTPAG
jgi:dGTPase